MVKQMGEIDNNEIDLGDSSMSFLVEQIAKLQEELEEFEALAAHGNTNNTTKQDTATTEKQAANAKKVVFADSQSQESSASSIIRPAEDLITVTAIKLSPSAPIGLSMKTSRGITIISAISTESVLHGSALARGHRIVLINGVTIENAKHARYLIQNSAENVTLVTEQMNIQN